MNVKKWLFVLLREKEIGQPQNSFEFDTAQSTMQEELAIIDYKE